MTALDIAFGAPAHLLLILGILAQFRAASDEAILLGFILLLSGLFGASYFWARVAGFA